MIKKKRCRNCGEKISNKYNFCPYCRAPIENDEDWGMLGKNDFTSGAETPNMFSNMAFGGVLGKMFNGAMKMLEKEFQKEMRNMNQRVNQGPQPWSNIRLMINGKEVNLGNQEPNVPEKVEKKLPNNKLRGFSKLPRKEPTTNIRRLSNKVIYEMKIPGVNSLENVSINQLENSIEIKAVSKSKAYSKIIPINLPIKTYNLSKGKLVLELDAKEN